jgi:hypothetical protein
LFAAACDEGRPHSWLVAREKYAVDLNHPDKAREIDEITWESAAPLKRADVRWAPSRVGERGVQDKGKLFEKSGPSWMGKYGQPVDAHVSASGGRIAVNSWEGIEDHGGDQAGYPGFIWQVHVKGRYWIDIYDTASAKPLARIQGAFHGPSPSSFLGYNPAFYSDRFYILPVGGTTGPDHGFNLRRLLVCDLDAMGR